MYISLKVLKDINLCIFRIFTLLYISKDAFLISIVLDGRHRLSYLSRAYRYKDFLGLNPKGDYVNVLISFVIYPSKVISLDILS